MDKMEERTLKPKSIYILGADLAHHGIDSSFFIVIEKEFGNNDLKVVFIEETQDTDLTDPVGRVWYLHKKFKFSRIYIDCTGLGSGPTDFLQAPSRVGGGIVEGVRFTVQSKMDMYSNLTFLFKTGRLKIPNHDKLKHQLLDLRCTIADNATLKIHHAKKKDAHDDACDALALAALYWKNDDRKRINWGAA